MQVLGMLVIVILMLIFMVVPVVLIIINIVQLVNRFRSGYIVNRSKLKYIDIVSVILSLIYFYLLWGYASFQEYDVPLVKFFDTQLHTPLSYDHIFIVLLIVGMGVISYILLKVKQYMMPPLMAVVALGFIIATNVLGGVWIYQLSQHFTNFKVIDIDIVNVAFYFALVPINFMICTVAIIKDMISVLSEAHEGNGWVNEFLIDANKWILFGFIAAIPMVIVLIIISLLFGQEPDSIIKAFTETSDWKLSTKISPPPIDYDGHYLCTVSIGGHKKIVKPKRYGIRHGKKIVVNRQLMIANAFEEVIQERTPRFHRFIRYIYDKYGLPISKLIRTKFIADIVYVLMKPLEIIFLMVIYSVDERPENRIPRQYLPIKDIYMEKSEGKRG